MYQGVYKAVLVTFDEQLMHLSRYIHRNPLTLQGVTLKILPQQSTSYADFLGLRKTEWLHPESILSYFSQTISNLSYQAFVNQVDGGNILHEVAIDLE